MRVIGKTTTSQYSQANQPAPSKLKPTKDKFDSKKKAVSHARDRESKIRQVEEARKRTDKWMEVQARKSAVINFIYVGNLEPRIGVPQLEKHFKEFGAIMRTEIRCSRGQAIGSGTIVPLMALTARDRRYATIEFHDARSVKKALSMNGSILDDCKIVVSVSPADLPEVQDIVQTHLRAIRERERPMPPSRIHFGLRPVARDDTERFDDYTKPATDRMRIFGFSFAKCIL